MIKQSFCAVLCFTAFLQLCILLGVLLLIGSVQDTDSNESGVGQIKFTTELVGLEKMGGGRLEMRAFGEMDMGLLLMSVIIKVKDAVKVIVTIASCHNFPCNFL